MNVYISPIVRSNLVWRYFEYLRVVFESFLMSTHPLVQLDIMNVQEAFEGLLLQKIPQEILMTMSSVNIENIVSWEENGSNGYDIEIIFKCIITEIQMWFRFNQEYALIGLTHPDLSFMPDRLAPPPRRRVVFNPAVPAFEPPRPARRTVVYNPRR